MDARESLARALLRSEVDVYSEDPWEEAGEEMHAAYLHDADAIIEELEQGGFIIVRKPLVTNPGIPPEGRLMRESRPGGGGPPVRTRSIGLVLCPP